MEEERGNFKVISLEFNESIRRWNLLISVKDINKFYDSDFKCKECGRDFEREERTYFCLDGRWFFHRECVIKSPHNRHFQTSNNPDHNDYLVLLEIEEEKQESKHL